MAAVSPAPTGPVPYRLLTLLRDAGPMSRAELARPPRRAAGPGTGRDRRAGRRPGTIREAGPAASRGGRRSTWWNCSRTSGSPPSTSAPPRSTSRSPTVGSSRSRPTASRPTSAPARRSILHRVNEILAQVQGRGRVTTGCTRSASACPARSASATACRCRRRSCPAGTATRCATCWPASTAARSSSTTT